MTERDVNGKFVAQAGMYLDSKGYWCYSAGPNRGRRVHRVLMEEHLGRRLRRDEVVHHRDSDKRNNGPHADGEWNLQLLTEREHNSISAKQYWFLRNRDRDEEQQWNEYFDQDEGASGVAVAVAAIAVVEEDVNLP